MISHFKNNGIDYSIELVDRIVLRIFSDYGMNFNDLNIIQFTDIELLELNRNVLDHDYFTDIITFNYENFPSINGELFISFERALENQDTFNKENEIIRYIIHGCLHLCGIEDSSQELKNKIHYLEDTYLNMFHVKH
ncbi:MAG: rRNA maturation RNase YbeY [Bacteroidia bacterium]